MPIIEGQYKYSIPKRYKDLLSDKLLEDFRDNLKEIFKLDDNANYWFDYSNFETSGGWARAFRLSCEKYNVMKLYRYYVKLQWFDSDVFDGELSKLMIERGVIPEGDLDEYLKMLAEENED